MKKNELKPWQKREWCIGRLTSEFLMRMEALLDVYELPYDPRYPVLCFDERPCQLLGETVVPIPMQPGKSYTSYTYDHQYEREGTCCLLIAVEVSVCPGANTAHQSGLCPIYAGTGGLLSRRREDSVGAG